MGRIRVCPSIPASVVLYRCQEQRRFLLHFLLSSFLAKPFLYIVSTWIAFDPCLRRTSTDGIQCQRGHRSQKMPCNTIFCASRNLFRCCVKTKAWWWPISHSWTSHTSPIPRSAGCRGFVCCLPSRRTGILMRNISSAAPIGCYATSCHAVTLRLPFTAETPRSCIVQALDFRFLIALQHRIDSRWRRQLLLVLLLFLPFLLFFEAFLPSMQLGLVRLFFPRACSAAANSLWCPI